MDRSIRELHVTLDSRLIYFPTFNEQDFDIRDIPVALSRLCRYNGLINRFYSVAQHSVLTCQLAEARYGHGSVEAKCALMHDAVEAYVGDVSNPLKMHLPDFQKMERKVAAVVNQCLGLPVDPKLWQVVTMMDVMAFRVETVYLMAYPYKWDQEPEDWALDVMMARSLASGFEMDPKRARQQMVLKMRQYGFEIPFEEEKF